MNWILVAFLEPIFHALANILDSNLTNRLFKNAWILTLLIAFATVLFLPLVWFLDPPKIPSLHTLPFFIAVGFIELLYSYPYFKALQNNDTSIAISLFALGKILVPVLAFFFLGELLRPAQYIGFLLIIVCSAALTLNPKARFKFNKSFFYMLASSSLLAVEVIVYKYIFHQVSWGTGFVWTMGVSALIGVLSFLFRKTRQSLKAEFPVLKKYYPLILLVGSVSFFGGIGFSYAISRTSATVARSIDSFQPFFVLLYALVFKRFFPNNFREEIDLRNLAKKIILFIITVVGVILTLK